MPPTPAVSAGSLFVPPRNVWIHTCLSNKRNKTRKLFHRPGSSAHVSSDVEKSVSGVEVVAHVVLFPDAKPPCFGFQTMVFRGIIFRFFMPKQDALEAIEDVWRDLFMGLHHLSSVQENSWPVRALLVPAAIAEETLAAEGAHPGLARTTCIAGVALRRWVVTGNGCLWTLHVVMGGCLGHCSAGLVEVEDGCAKFLGCGCDLRGALSGVEAGDEFSNRGTERREEWKSDKNGQQHCVKEIETLRRFCIQPTYLIK